MGSVDFKQCIGEEIIYNWFMWLQTSVKETKIKHLFYRKTNKIFDCMVEFLNLNLIIKY